MSNNTNINALASTVYNAGPDDKMAVADVYKISTSNIINSISKKERNDDNLDLINTGVFNESMLPPAKAYDDKQTLIDDKEAIRRISGDDSSITNYYRSLSDKTKQGLSSVSTFKDSIKTTIGNCNGTILPNYLKDANLISSMINSKSKGLYSPILHDTLAVAGGVAYLVNQASRLGLPCAFSILANSITDKPPLIGAAINLLPGIIKAGNINGLLDMANSIIKKDILKINPAAITSTITGFKLPPSVEQKTLSVYYDKVNTGFKEMDPNWNKSNRNNSSLSGYNIGNNNDFGKLISSKNNSTPIILNNPITLAPKQNDENFLQLMNVFKTTSVTKELNTLLPNIKLNNNKVSDHVINDFSNFA